MTITGFPTRHRSLHLSQCNSLLGVTMARFEIPTHHNWFLRTSCDTGGSPRASAVLATLPWFEPQSTAAPITKSQERI